MRTENDNGLIFDSLNAIFINNEYDDFNDIANSDNLYTIEGDNYFTDFSLVLQDLNFDGRLYTDGDITINATSVTSESKNSIIAFHTGNIVINSNEFNYKGIIFAPNGYVNINSKNIDFKGFIIAAGYNVPLVKTQMKKIIVTAKTLYSHPKNVSKIYAALHTDLAW